MLGGGTRRLLLAVVVAAVFADAVPAFASTQVPATTYTQDTAWTLAGSPYVVNGNVTVAGGATLTIEPGVIVKFAYQFASPKKIVVASGGVLHAAGTAANPIVFTSIKDDSIGGDTGGDGPTVCTMGDGGYVEVQSSSPLNMIASATMRCGPYGQGTADAAFRVSGSGSWLSVTDTDVSILHGSGFYVVGGTLELARVTVTEPGAVGVMVGLNGTANVEDTTIVGTNTTGSTGCGCGYGVRVADGRATVARTTLRNLQFGVSIILSATTSAAASSFYDNTIRDNGYGVSLSAAGGGSLPPFAQLPFGHRNNIYNNGGSTPDAKQLNAGGPSSAGIDWSNNYWGPTVSWRPNDGACAEAGYLAYPDSTPEFPKSPANRTTSYQSRPFPLTGVYCPKNYAYLGGAAGFAPVPFGDVPYLSSAETLGGADSAWRSGLMGLISDPVATSIGNFVHQESDLSLPGVGVPFRLVRTYNSLDTAAGVLGRGWTFNLNASLAITNGGNVGFRADDGAVFAFQKNPDGSFTRSPAMRGTLVAITGGYRLTRQDGLRYEFDSSGKLTSVTDRNGQGLTLAYTSGRLASVTDSASRVVSFSYNGSNKLSGVSLPDGRSVAYGYTTGGLLASVTDTRGKVWSYSYDARNYLTKETDPLASTVFRNVYDSTTGRVSDQYDALDNHTSFAWNASTQTATTTDPLGKQTVDVYAHNLLVSRTDPLAHTTSYTYDAEGNVASVTDPRGKTTTMTYDGRGNLLTRTAPAPLSFVEGWTYNAANDRTSYTNGRGKTWSYGYDANGNPTSVSEPGNKTTGFSYDSRGLLLSTTDPRGKTRTFTYDSAGNRITDTDPAGGVSVYGYDASGRPTSSVDPRGNLPGANPTLYTTTIAYDAGDHRTGITDALGNTTSYGYDNAGRLATVTNALTKTWTYGYNAASELTTVTAPNSSTATRTYTARGELASETTAAGRKTTYAYDDAGRLTSRVTPRGNLPGATPSDYSWSYGYDNAGNPTAVTDPLNHTRTLAYDELGRPTSLTDANSHTTSYAYDAAGNLTAVTDPLSHTTTSGYDDRNQLVSTTDARSKTTGYAYDDAGNLISVTDPAGDLSSYGYDDAGRLAFQVDPRGNATGADASDFTTSYAYDAAGNLSSTTDALGKVWARAYDRVGRLQSITDPLLHATAYGYDALGRLTSVTAPDSAITSYAYDNNSNDLTSRTDANQHVSSYAYNPDHELTSVSNPLGKTWTFGYDADGNLSERIDAIANAAGNPALGTTTYSHDRAGRLTGIDYSDTTPDVSYGYDNADSLSSRSDGAGTTTYGRDAADRLTSLTRGSDSFAYAYDDANRLTQTTYPDNTVIAYTYDDAGRLATLSSGTQTTSYGYDEAGALVARTLPNGVSESRSYDRTGLLATLSTSKQTSTLTSFALTRDDAGNPTQLTSAGGALEKYTYDQTGRPTSVCYQTACPNPGDPTISWTYDPVGNRQTETRPAGTITYAYNAADQLTSASGPGGTIAYGHDNDGRQTSAGSSSYSWNLADRLVSTTVGGTTTSYGYDGDGNRLSSTSGSTTTSYLWDENAPLPQLALERDGSGTPLRRHLHDTTGPLQLTTSGADYAYLLDPYDSVAGLTDSTGALARTTTYEPFGTVRADTALISGTPTTPLAFNGQHHDQTSDLYNLRARHYDAASGRFLTPDPLPPPLTDPYLATYLYANGQPTTLADPSGLRPGLDDLRALGKWALDRSAYVGGAIWDLTVTATIDDITNAWDCASRIAAGEARNATRQCVKTLIFATTLIIPGGRLAAGAARIQGRAISRLTVRARGSIRRSSPGRAAESATGVASGLGGETASMSIVRTVGRGEKVAELLNEGKALTFESGNEHALVRLASGERAIVSGGPGGIDFPQGAVSRVIAHTHPYGMGAGASSADFAMLDSYGQKSSWLLSEGVLSKFWAGG